jgi:hypothetical protein
LTARSHSVWNQFIPLAVERTMSCPPASMTGLTASYRSSPQVMWAHSSSTTRLAVLPMPAFLVAGIDLIRLPLVQATSRTLSLSPTVGRRSRSGPGSLAYRALIRRISSLASSCVRLNRNTVWFARNRQSQSTYPHTSHEMPS